MTNKKLLIGALALSLLGAAVAAAEVKLASDITRLAVGARPLGMGKMFTGLSDDLSAMYLNPAGLAGLEGHQALTMSGQFVNMVNYLTLAAATPLKYGTVGVGYIGAGFGFNTPVLDLVEIATGEYRVLPSSTESVAYDYGNSVLSFSYGDTFFLPELSLGTTVKFFSENISGVGGGTASGFDVDAGALYRPNDQLRLGATLRNFLPASMGGKVRWSTGLEEPIPSTLILGASYRLDYAAGLNLGLDYELQPTQSNIPHFIHAGVEFWPIKTFAVRAGIDQDVVGTGTGTDLTLANNATAGLSLFANDLRFDYAFHKYNDIVQNDTHYFSLALLVPKLIPFKVLAPEDKLISHDNSVLVRGEVKDPAIKRVVINDREVQVNRGEFQGEASLLLGKNTIRVAGLDRDGRVVEQKKLRVLRLIKFSDVPDDHWARLEIEQLGTLNIMPGYTDSTFKPANTTPRVDYLMSLLNIGQVPPATELKPFPFKDIGLNEQIAPYVKAGHDNQLVKGYPDRTFQPWRLLNRVEGAVMTVRFSKVNLSEVLERPYQDISARHWAIRELATAKEQNMLRFALEYLYPRRELPRAELASMIANTPSVKARIDELMDFETGY